MKPRINNLTPDKKHQKAEYDRCRRLNKMSQKEVAAYEAREKYRDVAGQLFGRLTPMERLQNIKRAGGIWICACICGSTTQASVSQLRNGGKQSCGCLKKELLKIQKTTHGMSETKTFLAWCNMRRRCYEVKNSKYESYGGRGISVCSQWNTFPGFLSDMGEAPVGMTLERLNVNGNYEPSNCVWETQKTQTRNQRRTIRIEVGGIEYSLIGYCEDHGLKYSRIRDRIRKFGWSVDRAISTP